MNDAAEIFNKYASEYAQKFNDVSSYGKSLDFFVEQLNNKNPSVLDLACGPGNVTSYLLKKNPSLRITGIDLAPNMIEIALRANPEARFLVKDIRDIAGLPDKYDGIMAAFCLPYLSKAETTKLIEDASLLLNAKGVLYLSTMEDAYEKSGYQTGSKGDKIYMYFHQAATLKTALAENGFDVRFEQRIKNENVNGPGSEDLVLIASGK